MNTIKSSFPIFFAWTIFTILLALISISIWFAKIDYPLFYCVGRGTIVTPRIYLTSGLVFLIILLLYLYNSLNLLPKSFINTSPLKLLFKATFSENNFNLFIVTSFAFLFGYIPVVRGINNFHFFLNDILLKLFIDIEFLCLLLIFTGVLCFQSSKSNKTDDFHLILKNSELNKIEIISKLTLFFGIFLQIIALILIMIKGIIRIQNNIH